MKGLYAVLLAGLALVAPSGCTRPCKEGTVFLRLPYAAGLNADNIQVTVRQLGTSFVTVREFAPSGSEDSLEIGFPGGAYPRDALLRIDVVAQRLGLRAGGGQGQVELGAKCTSVTVTVVPDSNPASPISHVPGHYLTDGTCDLTITTPTSTFNTGTGQFGGDPVGLPAGCVYGTESIPGNDGGPPSTIAVLAVRSLMVSSNGVLTVTGPNPLVIAAADSIQIDGTIDGSANFHAAGPGGLTTGPGVGGNGGNAATVVDSGGGGGSFGDFGSDAADADNSTNTVSGGLRGRTYNDATLSTLLQAGSAGGNGVGPVTNLDPLVACGIGGGGGGALQLTAKNSLQIGATGRLLVNGGGGLGGCGDNSPNEARSGGGGGSGGALFLESPMITIVNGAILAANGGGAGSGADPVGSTTPGRRGLNGQNGLASNMPAPGGAAVGGGSGTGGNGAAGTTTASSGTVTTATGGGGGGVGRIVLRAQTQPTTQATISPAATFVAF